MLHEFVFYEDGNIEETFNMNLDHALMRIQHNNKIATTNGTTKGQVLAMTYASCKSVNTPSLQIFEERRMLVLATEQAIFCVDSHNSNVTACTYEDEVEVGPPLVDDAVFSKDGDASNKVAELEISL